MPDGFNMLASRPNWDIDGADWPNRAHSRFLNLGDITWHVQVAGGGPVLLLLHGTAGGTHSWRDMLLPLAEHYTVVAPDLPGHGFTTQPPGPGMTPTGMATRLASLLDALGLKPEYLAGHSAGAAIAAQMCLDELVPARAIVSLNGALIPWRHSGPFFAKLIAKTGIMSILLSWQAADTARVKKFMTSIGSKLDADGLKFYSRLARRSGHTGAALTMMANWDLEKFYARLPSLKPRLLLIAGAQDGAVPPSVAETIQKLVPGAELVMQPGLGHLAHEEAPAETVKLIREFCR
jgi:magnesium chelatase accessory protein